jgi:hypothetical protein
MLKRLIPASALLLLAVAARPAGAQEAPACPPVEDGAGVPVELRVGDIVLRAQVSSADGAEGARVEGRLVGCARDRAGSPQEPEGDPVAGDAFGGPGAVLRLLHDLRVALELGPAKDGRCVRASVEVSDDGGSLPQSPAGRPLGIELCGLPFVTGEGRQDPEDPGV